MKRTLGILLLAFAAISAAFAILREAGGPAGAAPRPLPPECQLVVYYFHTDKRCTSCNTIEAAAKQAVETRFAPQAAAGQVVYRDINWQRPANAHYQPAYHLAFSTVVLSRIHEGREVRHQRLDELWQLLPDQAALVWHIEDRMQAMLEGE